ncbi:MAG: putative light sensor protein, partial [Nocardioides sp.]|nr:putative light sensor protein [Nocardioides sp.]
AVEQGISVSVTLLNYRKDGSEFWNQVDLSPVRDPEGRIAHYVGIQTDVTVRVEAELETRRALDAEREARADAETARSRVSFLIEAMNQLSGTLDVAESAGRLLSLVVPYLADWAVLLPSGRSDPALMVGRHRHAVRQHDVDELLAELPAAMRDGVLSELLLGDQQVRLLELNDPTSLYERARYLRDMSLTERTRALGGNQALMVALSGRSAVHDVLVLVRAEGRQQFSEADVDMALDLGRRAGTILENASLYEAQARIAEVLQRSLLPDLPHIEGVSSAARYLANETSAEIGGDFYELLDFHDAGIGIAIGDVSGHDILAAAAMGHLKGLLRAAAFDDFASPATVLEKVDRLMLGLGMPTIATAVFAHAVPHDGGWRLTWTGAGHPPMLVRQPDGKVDVLPVHLNDVLLGLQEGGRTQHEVRLPRGATVIAYTDGLVERRGETLDEGLHRLLDAVASGPVDAEQLCDHVLAAMGRGTRDDDIALLAVTLD